MFVDRRLRRIDIETGPEAEIMAPAAACGTAFPSLSGPHDLDLKNNGSAP